MKVGSIRKKGFALLLALMTLISCIPAVTVSSLAAVTTGNSIREYWIKDVAIPSGWSYTDAAGKSHSIESANLSIHYVDMNSNGEYEPAEVIYCINKELGAESSVKSLKTQNDFMQTNYWLECLTTFARQGIIRATIYGWPNYSSGYGVADVTSVDKIYATQVLIWEFSTNQRTNYNSLEPQGKFSSAFTYSAGACSGYTYMKTVNFTKAKAYYQKLVAACRDHQVVSGLNATYTINSLGTHTFTDAALSGCTVRSLNTDFVTASISGNNLTVNVKKGVNAQVELTKNITTTSSYVPCMINSGSGQELLYGTIKDPQSTKITFNATSLKGGWTLTKKDEDGNGIKNIVFGLYTSNNSISSQKLDGNTGEWFFQFSISDFQFQNRLRQQRTFVFRKNL